MAHALYEQVIPVYARMLTNLDQILTKAEADAAARKIEPETLLSARLAPDMFPFTRQVQVTTDHAKFAACRLTGTEPPKWPDEEKSFAELHERIAKALTLLREFKPAQFDGAESRTIELKFPNGAMTFTGSDYITLFSLPNFYFHYTAAYTILRHNGVPIGKMDFLGAPRS